MKKLILISLIIGISSQVQADDVNIDKGQALTQKGYCYTCHGDTGIAPSRNAPSLAGQSSAYLIKVMHEYRSKSIYIDHKSLGMQAIMQPMSNQNIQDVAAFYASQTPALSAAKNKDPNVAGACLGCHTIDGKPGLSGSAPGLAGMSAGYIKRQLNAYKNGLRSDTMMKRFSQNLNADSIERLSQYYGTK